MLLDFLLNKNKKGLVLLAFFYGVIFSGCERSSPRVLSIQGPTMGTTFNIKLIDETGTADHNQVEAVILDELLKINQSMSTYIPNSELSRLNQADIDTWFSVSSDLCEVLSVAKEIYGLSNKRFDPTIGPLVNIWGFGPEDREGVPDAKELSGAQARVGFNYVDLNCESLSVRKLRAVYIDLSAIAKGYAADILARRLNAMGFSNAMIEIGGELYLGGKNAEKIEWRIAIEKPSLGHSGAVQILKVSNVGVATSGEYRNYYEVDGHRVSHTIDPLTAKPIDHNLASVTVVASNAGVADALATALNVMGPEEGYRLAEKQDLAAYFIVREEAEFSVKYTKSFKQYMVMP